jgi:hypothetical protein
MIQDSDKICPKCHSKKMKTWAELTDEEKFLVERLPLSAQYSPSERRKHRFCTLCWFEGDSKRTLA